MVPSAASSPVQIGLRFKERMNGWVVVAGTEGSAARHAFEFTVTVTADNLEQFLHEDQHSARLSGVVRSTLLGAGDIPIQAGIFNLLVDDPSDVATRHFNYSIHFDAPDGSHLYLFGQKTVRNDAYGLDGWSDTTTLAVTLFAGGDSNCKVLARGTLHLSPGDFLRELKTIEILNAPDEKARLRGAAQFVAFFAGKMFDMYGNEFLRPNLFNPDAPPRAKRPLRVGPLEEHWATTSDQLKLKLTRYRGGEKGPVLLVHGLGVSSLIFSMDTIETNLLEFLYARGYDVWLFDFRSSIDLPYAGIPYTADDVATKDYPAAVQYVRDFTGKSTIQCVVHCFGANTFFMAMLAGLTGVRSAAVSQTAANLRVPFLSYAKSVFHVADILKMFGVKELDAYVDTHLTWRDSVADFLLRFYPVHDGPRDTNPVSRRISFIYGLLYELDQLNQATYDNLHEMFGIAGITSLQQMTTMVRAGKIVTFEGKDDYLRENEGFPTINRLAIPMLILHGAENQCWLPESTLLTFDLLRAHNDPALYERKVIPNYGHIDSIFGKDAARDIFPHMLEHLEKTAII